MNNIKKVNIDWKYEDKLDLALGNGANKQEKILGWASCLVIPLFLLFYVNKEHIEWNYIQLIIAIIVAFDIGGGMVCNSLNSCKRFYHSNSNTNEKKYIYIIKNHLVFSSLHIHTIIVWLVFDINNWINGFIWYFLLMISVISVNWAPLYIKRPLSMLIILFSIMINLYIIKPVIGFEWLVPVLFIKIVYGHLVREEPYRP